jgi:hypothetical protein
MQAHEARHQELAEFSLQPPTQQHVWVPRQRKEAGMCTTPTMSRQSSKHHSSCCTSAVQQPQDSSTQQHQHYCSFSLSSHEAQNAQAQNLKFELLHCYRSIHFEQPNRDEQYFPGVFFFKKKKKTNKQTNKTQKTKKCEFNIRCKLNKPCANASFQQQSGAPPKQQTTMFAPLLASL